MSETVAALVIEDEVDRLHGELQLAQTAGADIVRRYVAEHAHKFFASGTLNIGGRLDAFIGERAYLTVDNVLALLAGDVVWTREGRLTALRMRKGFDDDRPVVAKLRFLAERWKDVPWAVFAADAGASSGGK